MKAIFAVLLILVLAIYVHLQKSWFPHFLVWKPWSFAVVLISILAASIPLGRRNVINAFRGEDQEAGKRIIQTLACTGIITVTLSVARICQNLSTPDNIGPIATFCFATVIHSTLVTLFLVLQGQKNGQV